MRSRFWVGFAIGAAGVATASLWARNLNQQGSMIRVERSVKIERPASEVFAACARLERMPQWIRWVASVATSDDISLWIADIEGHRYAWDLEIVQVIPNQVIGWTSHRSQPHSGKINFFALGAETLVQVDMNCARRSGLTHFFEGPTHWSLGDAIEAALHDLKASLEGKRNRSVIDEARSWPRLPEEKATGTYGPPRTRLTQEEPPAWNNDDDADSPFDDRYV